MEMIALIVSGLALLAAGVCLCLLMREKKRNQERNAAVLDLIKTEREAADRCATARAEELVRKMFLELAERVKNLENGIVPDYQQAMAAADALNDFNRGISNILGFDPREALEKQREKERQGE